GHQITAATLSRNWGTSLGAVPANAFGQCRSRTGQLRIKGLRAPPGHRQVEPGPRIHGRADQRHLRLDHPRAVPRQHGRLPARPIDRLGSQGDGEPDGRRPAPALRRAQLLLPPARGGCPAQGLGRQRSSADFRRVRGPGARPRGRARHQPGRGQHGGRPRYRCAARPPGAGGQLRGGQALRLRGRGQNPLGPPRRQRRGLRRRRRRDGGPRHARGGDSGHRRPRGEAHAAQGAEHRRLRRRLHDSQGGLLRHAQRRGRDQPLPRLPEPVEAAKGGHRKRHGRRRPGRRGGGQLEQLRAALPGRRKRRCGLRGRARGRDLGRQARVEVRLRQLRRLGGHRRAGRGHPQRLPCQRVRQLERHLDGDAVRLRPGGTHPRGPWLLAPRGCGKADALQRRISRRDRPGLRCHAGRGPRQRGREPRPGRLHL
ncbi:MAG: hypothetical protein AVDCRST_MAG03-1113, partial [uncultured Rubrobacteraceae bacterium]